MTNIDIIKEYVNTGVKLPESQISKLTPELKATYLRKRIMVQDRQKNLAEYEWGLMNIKQKEFCIEKLGYKGFYNLIKTSSNKDKLKQEYKTIKGKDFIEYEWVDNFYNGVAQVKLSDDTFNYIDKQGNLLSKQNFKRVYDFEEGFGLVQLSKDNWNYIDTKGNLLSKQNFKRVSFFNDGFAVVQLSDNKRYYIDKDLNFYDSKTKTPVPSPFNSINESLRGLVEESIKEELKRKKIKI
jgi:hypothetical protein